MLIKRRNVLIKSFSTLFKLSIKIKIKNDYKSVSKENVSNLFNNLYFSL